MTGPEPPSPPLHSGHPPLARRWTCLAVVMLALFAAVPGPAHAAGEPCPPDFKDRTEPLTCTCPAQATRAGEVWGDGIYTADSHICRAARHAGAIRASGGIVTVLPAPGQDAYGGTARNGILSHGYGGYWASYRFDGVALAATLPCPANLRAKDAVADLTCTCDRTRTAVGEVWGSNPYTADSAICRAARHAGVIDRGGGTVTLTVEAGRPGYRGSARNGVSSSAYDDYDRSFRIAGAAPPDFGTLCPGSFTGFAAEKTPLDCLCTAEAAQTGKAWGDTTYTSDSAICRAALHSGAIGPSGGQVRVTRTPGSPRYAGTDRNGVLTTARGAWPYGFSVGSAQDGFAAPMEPSSQTALAASLDRDGEAQLHITFPTGSVSIDPVSLPLLADLLTLLETDRQLHIELIGHTDSHGNEAANDALSLQRAKAVLHWLTMVGIDADRLSASGRGERVPLAPNDTEAGRALNRRVQIVTR